MSTQMRTDEELGQRFVAEHDWEQQGQLELDEQVAHGWVGDEDQLQSFSVECAVEALDALSPLRAMRRNRYHDSHIGTMIDIAFQKLEDVVAASQPGPSTAVVSIHTSGGTGDGAETVRHPAGASSPQSSDSSPPERMVELNASSQGGPSTAVASIATAGGSGHSADTGRQPAVVSPAQPSESAPRVLSMAQEETIRVVARTGSVEAVLAAAGVSSRLLGSVSGLPDPTAAALLMAGASSVASDETEAVSAAGASSFAQAPASATGETRPSAISDLF